MKPTSAARRLVAVAAVAASVSAAVVGVHAATPDLLSFLFRVGSEGTAQNQFVYPIGIAVGGPENQIYVTDTESFDGSVLNDRIQVFGPDGSFRFTFGGPGSDAGQFSFPYGVAVDGQGMILVADSGNNRIQLFNQTGAFVKSFGHYANYDSSPWEPANRDAFGNYVGPTPELDGLYFPTRVALRPGTRLNDASDTAGRVAVLDNSNHRVVVLDSMLQPLFAFGTFGVDGNGLGNFEYPFGVGMDATRIYVADPQNHRIQVFDQDGNGLFFFGSTGATNSPGDLQNPYDAQPDNQGRLFVADTDNNRVLILVEDPNASLTPRCSDVVEAREAGRCAIVASNGTRYDARVVGTEGTSDGEFRFPQSVGFDALGRVLVLDSDNHRFQVFQGTRVRVTSASATATGPVHSGDTVSVTATVKNEGAAPLTIAASAIPSLNGQLSADGPQIVAGGDETSFTFTFVASDTGSLTFDVSATGSSATGATVVDGPVRTNAITVGSSEAPQLLVSLQAGPAKVGLGGDITATITLKNTGSVALTDVTPQIVAAPAGLVTGSDAQTPVDLAAGGSRTFTYSYTASATSVGTVTFAAGGTGSDSSGGSVGTPASMGPSRSVQIVSDAQAPSSTLVRSGAVGQSGWYTSDVQVAITATDNDSVAFINYRVDGLLPFNGRVAGAAASFPVRFQGGVDVTYWAEDNAGNVEAKQRAHFGIDSDAPTISAGGVQPAPNGAGWNDTYPLVSFLASDGGSGVASVTAAQTIRSDAAGIVVPGAATDVAGNSGNASITVNVDTLKPVVVCTPTTLPTGKNGWYTTASVTVTCSAIDQPSLSGLLRVSAVCVGGTTGTTPFTPHGSPGLGPLQGSAACTLTAEGKWDVHGEAVDVAGNVAISTPIEIKIDRTPPALVCGTASGGNIWPPDHKMVAWNTFVQVKDALSGDGGFTLAGFGSSEAPNAKGDGNTLVDMSGWTLFTPDVSGFVRAERSGLGTGRIYRLYYDGYDGAGNKSSCVNVLTEVPHDQDDK